ncbi:MAG: glycosyltransferase family 9 protein [Acidiferrobacter sp.]
MNAPRVLVIRRDNIGDLVCTLPLFEGMRQHFPNARIGALVNSYNAPLLQGNPFIDDVHIYTKSKHRPGSGRLALGRDRWTLFLGLRRPRYQIAVHAGTRVRTEMRVLTRLAGIKDQILDHVSDRPLHEVERVYGLLHAFGITGSPPAPRLSLSPQSLTEARGFLAAQGFEKAVGLHISARENSNRWPLENFAAVIKMGAQLGLRFVVFWSPGDPSRPEHPGDDERARALQGMCRGLPLILYPTADLPALGAGLAAVRTLVGADGGHCHMAAAISTPVIGLYCANKVAQWRPWGTSHTVLYGQQVPDISVDAVLAALSGNIKP